MLQIHLLKSVQLIEKTMPCALSKLWKWTIACFCYLAATLAGAGVGLIVFAFGVKSSALASMTAILGFLGCGYILVKLRGSIFVPLRMGHVKVIIDQMESEKILSRQEQLERSSRVVKDYFNDDVSALAQLERKIRHVLLAVYCKELNIERYSFGNKYLKKILEMTVQVLTAFVSEAILAFYLSKGGESPSSASKKALALFVRDMDDLSKVVWVLNAFVFISWIFFVIAMLFLINWLVGMLPVSFGFWNVVFAMVFAWGIKATFLESIAVASLIGAFFESTKSNGSTAAAEKKLAEISAIYSELK